VIWISIFIKQCGYTNQHSKQLRNFFHFRLVYDIEALFTIECELLILRTATKTRLNLDESQQRRLIQLNELEEVQLRARQTIEVILAKIKKAWDVKVKKRVFKTGDLVMMYDSRHFCRAHKKLLPK
jgi:hypothetical protein